MAGQRHGSNAAIAFIEGNSYPLAVYIAASPAARYATGFFTAGRACRAARTNHQQQLLH
jgi:hypothetical protein